MSDWYVYMLRCADESLYTGIATDIEARVAKHNTGKAAKYTRSRRPVVLVYQETAADRSTAQRREAEIKQLRPEFRDRPQHIARLMREFRQTRSLAHPRKWIFSSPPTCSPKVKTCKTAGS